LRRIWNPTAGLWIREIFLRGLALRALAQSMYYLRPAALLISDTQVNKILAE
jgi:hypothetical protein